MISSIKATAASPKAGRASRRRLTLILHLLGYVVFLPWLIRPRRKPARLGVHRRILLLRVDGVGDFVMTTPLLAALRKTFPQARIDLLCSEAAHGLAAMFVREKILDHIYPLPFRPGLSRALRTARMLRKNRYDLAVDVRGDSRNVILAWLSGAPRRYGLSYSGLNYLLTAELPFEIVHQIEEVRRMGDLLEAPVGTPTPFLPLGDGDRQFAQTWLTEHGAHDNRPLVALHLSAFQQAKLWPIERFADVARKLQAQHGARLLIIGAPSDEPIAGSFSASLPEPAIIAAGQTNLAQTTSLLARCALFIGNDSGPAHIAAAVGCPTIVLFGPTDPFMWKPHGKAVAVLKSSHPCWPHCTGAVCADPDRHCLKSISVEAVCHEIDKLRAF